MTSFSPFDKRLLEEGLAYFDRPRLASLLEMLGTSKTERVDALVTMLRSCPPEEFDEALEIFERATTRAARQRDWEDERDRDDSGDRRRRYSASAERRAQRRRTS
jgi:ribosomal protein S21